MENVENKISELRKKLEAKKQEKNKAEASLEMYEKQLAEVTAQIKELGYQPDELPEVISRLEKSILENLNEAKRILDEADPMPTGEAIGKVGIV
ncbi:MAG: hypothetical protein AB7E31_14680 [Desulfitobacterium sp.]